MCGRYTLVKLADLLRLIPWLQVPADILEREARYNVAPSQVMPIITADGLRTAQWGFVPAWAKEPPKVRPINARAETAATSAMFRGSLAKRRCLVPADGFYEWKGAKPPKQPYLIRMRDATPFAFAGLWDRWQPAGGESIDTYTILTTAPNELMASIHNRMPVIIPAARYADWLNGDGAAALLQSYPADKMQAFAVSCRVNSPKNDVPDCTMPLD
jgi:putative SOS response-associated peptidase YedK